MNVLRYSRTVPLAAANLAYIDLPPLDVIQNTSIIETGKFIAENINLTWTNKLDPLVLGEYISTDTTTGYVYLTTYNAPIDSLTTSGSSTYAGESYYQVPRTKSTSVSPSGFVVENFTSEIRVLHPTPNQTEVWRLRIQDGVIVRHYVIQPSDNSWLTKVFSVDDELVCYYSIPDVLRIPYENDDISLEDAKVVSVSGVIATIIDGMTIQLPDRDIYQVSSLLINGQQLITDPSFILSLTNEPPIGPFTVWNPVDGTLTLNRTIGDNDIIQVNYKYREYLYLYEGFLDDNNMYHDLDLNPQKGHTYDGGKPTSELLNIPIYLYLIPTAAYKYKDSGGNFTQDRTIYTADRWTQAFVRWEKTYDPITQPFQAQADVCKTRSTYGNSYFGSAHFVDSLSVDTLSSSASGTGLANQPSAVVLAKIFVTSSSQLGNVSVVDTRSFGGGVPVVLDINSSNLPGNTKAEASTYWDISGWDGTPLPLGGVLIVEIPSGVLTGTGGYSKFEQSEIEAIINSSIASGIRPIIRYVD